MLSDEKNSFYAISMESHVFVMLFKWKVMYFYRLKCGTKQIILRNNFPLKFEIMMLDQKQSQHCLEELEQSIVTFSDQNYRMNSAFCQRKAAIRTAKLSKERLQCKSFTIIIQLIHYTHCNHVEKLCGITKIRVYDD